MSYVSIDGSPEQLASAFNDELEDMLDDTLRSNAHYLAEVMKQLTPVRTGETQASIGVEEGYLEYGVGSDNPVFGWLDEGTSPHFVAPVTAQALHWHDIRADTDSTEFFSKGHIVGGIPALNIIENAMALAEPAMDLTLEQYLDMAFEKAAAQSYGVEEG